MDIILRRPHIMGNRIPMHGRVTIDITCPFCKTITTCYEWSIAGNGKKCKCGAVHRGRGNTTLLYKAVSVFRKFEQYCKMVAKISNDSDKPHYGGNPYVNCTRCAQWVIDNVIPTGEIWGYEIEDDKRDRIGNSEGGHDFVLIDNRYIIDFWYFEMNGRPLKIWDMKEQPGLIERFYGPPSEWEKVCL